MQENDGTVPKPIEGFIPNKAEGVERLVRAIRHVMIDHDLVDGDFADQVGVDQAAWSRIKNRTAEPGAKFLAGALRAFPELEREIDRKSVV